ncbi:MAG: undecaprenyldiphospho-muramoylpentapeptide beta-N-acetylglucosaminyltransferase [Candidatus Eremiobacteraeota bacterium]|nr:undecaprenyldiphospho-muramoylpentapeptide beta-N-acetylglucosaminyltransferase [Candidatus Eremiobacteraeota bacterium]
MTIVFTGGGTGGHLYPAIAIADALKTRANVRFIGTADRLEATIVPQAGYLVEFIAARPLSRKVSIVTLRTLGTNLLGLVQAMRLLLANRPDIVIASGGYVCFPVVLAARMLRMAGRLHAPIAVIEINARPGLTNRLIAPLADEVWGAFANADSAFDGKYVHTGVPIRASLRALPQRFDAIRRLGLDPNRRTILIVGGSLGARSLNVAAAALITRRALPDDWQVLHVSGERDYEYMKAEESVPLGGNHARLFPYLTNMADAYAAADLVVARSGASTLGELAALGLPAILVPYPFAAENHQLENAHVFEAAGAARILPDGDLNPDSLWWALDEVMKPSVLQTMRLAARSLAVADPTARIVARIDALLARKNAG